MASIKQYVDLDLQKNQLVQARIENRASAPTSPLAGQLYYNTSDNNYYGWNGTVWLNLSQILTSAVQIAGEITNANTNPAYPSSPTVGDIWFITTNAGTVGGQAVEINDQLIYSTSGWFVMQRNLQYATTAIAGFVELADQSETNAGSDTTKAVTPSTLAGFLANYLYARKVVTTIATLTANTPTTVTHGLGLLASVDLLVQCWQGGEKAQLAIVPTSVNAFTVESNITLSSVKVISIG